jgi:hypothetical protein
MPVVCDFNVIQGDAVRRIGDGATLWEQNFNTGGRHPGGNAILMLMVKGLTVTDSDVEVLINNTPVGIIEHYNGADNRHWFTQVINIGPNILNDGNNELQIQAVSYDEAVPGDLYDDFFVKDVVCIFQQAA